MYGIENASIRNLTIQNGFSEGSGGGIYCDGKDIAFENLIIRENKAIGYGGGVFFRGRSCIFKNVVIANNETENIEIITGVYTNYQGAGLALEGYEIDLVNITITENSVIGPNQQPYFSGGLDILTSMSDVSLMNSIIVNNYPCNINQNNNSELKITYSNIEGGEEGIIRDTLETTLHWLEGNIDQDPLFVGGEPFDYHLSEGSPCIDTGTPFFAWEGDTILNLSPEEYEGEAPDMGAFGIDPISSIKKEKTIPLHFQLYQNYPNPFNSRTVISWQLAVGNNVDLSIYNILGQKVATLVSEKQAAGYHRVEWDASEYASGLYFCKLKAGGYTKVRKLLLIR
jgi:hypothetical protein